MYVALFPCNECAKLIIQSGIKDVVYLSDKYHDDEIMVASRRLFDLAGVSTQCRAVQCSAVQYSTAPHACLCACGACPACGFWHSVSEHTAAQAIRIGASVDRSSLAPPPDQPNTPPHNTTPCARVQVRYRQHVPKMPQLTIDFTKA